MLTKKNLGKMFSQFEETWTPKICGQVNDTLIKVAKFEDEFIWHSHAEEDEMFFVVSGRLRMELRDQPSIILNTGEFLVVPKGVEHKPVAETPTEVMLVEPSKTLNTGAETNERTVAGLDII